MTTPHTTPTQTVGPFFWNSLLREDAVRNVLAGPEAHGERIRVTGRVLDGDSAPVPDAMVEIWQANSFGRYQHPADSRLLPLDPAFMGFGRSGTDEEGRYRFETVKPGAVPFRDERMQAPHIVFTIFSRGLLNHLFTRLYFADDPGNVNDPVLLLVPSERRTTLLAPREVAGEIVTYRFDIVLQGADETVFFNM
jgi:protocatechuate 3,4-dioxygenase, alpha subunit